MFKGWRGRVGIIMGLGCIVFVLAQWHQFIFLGISEKTEIVKFWVLRLGVWAPAVYILGYILRPLVFFPATPFAIIGGLLFGSAWGTLYILIGAMCSSVCEFLLVRYVIGEKAKQFLKEKSRKVNEMVVKHGLLTVFLVRLIPNVAFDLQNCGFALAPIKFKHFFYGTLLGCFPACILYASLGGFVSNWVLPSKIGFMISALVFFYIVFILMMKKKVIKTK